MEEALFQPRLTTTVFSCLQPHLDPFHFSIWERCFKYRSYHQFQLQSYFRVSECTSDIFSDTELTRNSDQNSNPLILCILLLLIKLYNFHYFASPNSAYKALETSYKLLPRRQNLLRPRGRNLPARIRSFNGKTGRHRKDTKLAAFLDLVPRSKNRRAQKTWPICQR